jgi:hypothetical protein
MIAGLFFDKQGIGLKKAINVTGSSGSASATDDSLGDKTPSKNDYQTHQPMMSESLHPVVNPAWT